MCRSSYEGSVQSTAWLEVVVKVVCSAGSLLKASRSGGVVKVITRRMPDP